MSLCPKCGASVSLYDTAGNPWYACGSVKTFRSASCVDREPVATQLRQAQDRIKQLEEELMDTKNKHAVLVADVVLNEDRADRITHLEAALRRIANQDYRGNRSTESQIAFEALKEAKP